MEIKNLTTNMIKKTIQEFCDTKQDIDLSATEILGQDIVYRDTPELDEVRIVNYFKHEFIELTLTANYGHNGVANFSGSILISTRYLTHQDWNGECLPIINIDQQLLTRVNATNDFKDILKAIIIDKKITNMSHIILK